MTLPEDLHLAVERAEGSTCQSVAKDLAFEIVRLRDAVCDLDHEAQRSNESERQLRNDLAAMTKWANELEARLDHVR